MVIDLPDFSHPCLFDDNLSIKILSQSHEHLLLTEVVGEHEYAVALVLRYDLVQGLVGLILVREIILVSCEGVVQVQVVNIDGYSFILIIGLALRIKSWVLQHSWMEPKISSMENSAHFTLEEHHDSPRAMVCIHEGHLEVLLLFIVEVNHMFLIHLKGNNIVC